MTQTSPTADTRRVMHTVAEAADELAVTERFLRKLISEGQLCAVKVGTRSSASAAPTSTTSCDRRGWCRDSGGVDRCIAGGFYSSAGHAKSPWNLTCDSTDGAVEGLRR